MQFVDIAGKIVKLLNSKNDYMFKRIFGNIGISNNLDRCNGIIYNRISEVHTIKNKKADIIL